MEQRVITVTKTATEQVAANRVRIALTVYGEAKKYAAAVDCASDATAEVLRAFSGLDGVSLKNRGINVAAVRDDKNGWLPRGTGVFRRIRFRVRIVRKGDRNIERAQCGMARVVHV